MHNNNHYHRSRSNYTGNAHSTHNNSGRNGRGTTYSDWTQADEDTIKRPALPLNGYADNEEDEYEEGDEGFEDGAVPASGLQYLKMVRAQANACPQVVRVDYPSHKQQNHGQNPTTTTMVPDIRHQYFTAQNFQATSRQAPTPPHLRPTPEWLASFLARFEALRSTLAAHRKALLESGNMTSMYKPHPANERAWKTFCYGDGDGERGASAGSSLSGAQTAEEGGSDHLAKRKIGQLHLPETHAAKRARMDQQQEGGGDTTAMDIDADVDTNQTDASEAMESIPILEEEEEEEGQSVPTPPPRNDREPCTNIVVRLEQGETIRLLNFHAKWLNETTSISEDQGQWLFALLLRLDPLLTADELAILRILCKTCRRLRSAMATDLTLEDPRTASLNMVVAIVGRVFGQLDLSDDAEF
ncbi:survival motor neuron interacting protein 1-domain-containing protein [Fimicolochytrium jonesii]|uniref:survival motor neuron interacting protein 1-domain-containing protein n=1 Tax=Fimicolochytrium jonesii TaxID=1396493 RepID=UPI0022FE86A8|nr:survival motor neuron interacting protein 1-domain-containing protein [Fimicolochytrium jonesii]KAI8821526.1 survival motor neuron interacting protein 1-domain-containing protein [Fimicolochytrium jonesii]